jgi:hypothetical protein
MLLRPILLAAAAIALIAPLHAAEPELSGNWLVTYSPAGGIEQGLVIVKVEMKDGKPSISSVSKGGMEASGFEFTSDKGFKFTLNKEIVLEGRIESDEKIIGSMTSDRFAYRAKLIKTEKTEIGAMERVVRVTPPAPAAESQKLLSSVNTLRFQASREKDVEKKKELMQKVEDARKEANEKLPGLLREIVAKHADTPFALDAELDLLRGAEKYKVTTDEAKKLVADAEKTAATYGPRFARATSTQLLDILSYQKGMNAVALPMGERLTKALTSDDSPEHQSQILSAYKAALELSPGPNKDTLKTVSTNLNKVETKLDQDYKEKVPPFKPTPYAGRTDKTANRVVVMELFTGAQCPPCVAADVAFDALEKSYKPTEVVLIQYHLHIPGPDPLTNSDTVARAKYYDVNSTPTTLFNGKPRASGGGAMGNAERKFKEYAAIIDPLLEKTADVKVGGKAHRTGDKLHLAVDVNGTDGEEMMLRILVVEETIKYTGGNGLRFHHQVVRAMPGGVEGVAIKDKAFKHTASVDLVDVRKEITGYLDEYAANTSPFPKPQRPLDLKSLRVIALVQNDKTKEIVQAVEIEVENGSSAGSGG